jgi:hypothetical protein
MYEETGFMVDRLRSSREVKEVACGIVTGKSVWYSYETDNA